MKRSILSTIILTLIASIELAEGCSWYRRCRCQMANGSINNDATQKACDYQRENIRGANGDSSTAFETSIDVNGTLWCNYGRNGQYWYHPNNCNMREACASYGADGSDSWCEEKKNS
ncbi:hypothetical protein LZ32DRAFT_106270 [Colletotrichum eremochloae]|nr:hypothetical protein LZ32DRAFT_106270 [Colletotrichum eremochloae]